MWRPLAGGAISRKDAGTSITASCRAQPGWTANRSNYYPEDRAHAAQVAALTGGRPRAARPSGGRHLWLPRATTGPPRTLSAAGSASCCCRCRLQHGRRFGHSGRAAQGGEQARHAPLDGHGSCPLRWVGWEGLGPSAPCLGVRLQGSRQRQTWLPPSTALQPSGGDSAGHGGARAPAYVCTTARLSSSLVRSLSSSLRGGGKRRRWGGRARGPHRAAARGLHPVQYTAHTLAAVLGHFKRPSRGRLRAQLPRMPRARKPKARQPKAPLHSHPAWRVPLHPSGRRPN